MYYIPDRGMLSEQGLDTELVVVVVVCTHLTDDQTRGGGEGARSANLISHSPGSLGSRPRREGQRVCVCGCGQHTSTHTHTHAQLIVKQLVFGLVSSTHTDD